jgi:hypothetical protein
MPYVPQWRKLQELRERETEVCILPAVLSVGLYDSQNRQGLFSLTTLTKLSL